MTATIRMIVDAEIEFRAEPRTDGFGEYWQASWDGEPDPDGWAPFQVGHASSALAAVIAAIAHQVLSGDGPWLQIHEALGARFLHDDGPIDWAQARTELWGPARRKVETVDTGGRT